MPGTIIQELPLVSGLFASVGANATFTRAGRQNYQDDLGVWRAVTADNSPCFSSRGILLEPARTNWCAVDSLAASVNGVTCTGGIIPATTNDAARLAVNGLNVLAPAGLVFTVLNNSGTQQILTIAGVSGNTNAHAFSLYAYAQFGTASAQLTGGKGTVAIPLRNDANPFPRVTSESITGCGGTETMEIVLGAGAQVRFILPQLESGPDTAAAGVTSPILNTIGNRNTRNATVLTVQGSGLPANNFAATVEVTPTTTHQNSDAAYLFDIYGNATNRVRVYGNGVASKVTPTTNTQSLSAWIPQRNRTSIVALVQGNLAPTIPQPWVDNYGVFADQGSPFNVAANNEDINIANAVIYLGAKQDGSQRYAGWLRNFRIYSGNFTQSEARGLTSRYQEVTTLSTLRGDVLHDATTPGTVWALDGWNGTAFTTISTSTDYGETWSLVATLATPTTQATLQRDTQGNFYYSTTEVLRRLRVSPASDAVVITWDLGPADSGTPRTWSWLPWHWGVSNEGRLFTAAYTLDGLGAQCFWISLDNGLTWAVNRTLATQFPANRHIHGMGVNPVDNRLYVAIGDDGPTRGNFVTASAVQSWDASTWVRLDSTTDAKGATGIAFTSEFAYWSSDTVGNTNYVVRNTNQAGSESRIYRMPLNIHLTPLYFLQAVGPDKLIVVAYNEVGTTVAEGALLILEKMPGANTGQWSCARMYPLGVMTTAPTDEVFYAISHAGRQSLPASTQFFFVSVRSKGQNRPAKTIKVSLAEVLAPVGPPLAFPIDTPVRYSIGVNPVLVQSGANTGVDGGRVHAQSLTPKISIKLEG